MIIADPAAPASVASKVAGHGGALRRLRGLVREGDGFLGRRRTVEPLPEQLAGLRVCELGCGHGRLARYLAGAGAAVTAVDLSDKLLAYGRSIEQTGQKGIDYILGDVTRRDWWDGRRFDGVVCEMALMDMDDLQGVLETAAAVVVPGGWFAFSIVHPCHPGGPGTASGLPSWPPDGGYDAEGWWTNGGPIGIRSRVGANHRKLSTYLNAVMRAGFVFDAFIEPPFEVPRFFACRCHIAG